jgi:MFS family permease
MADAESSRRLPGPAYNWTIVGLLWFCGFFNYADRQAVFSVLPLVQDEFGLSNSQLGLIGSSFMVVYACVAPFSGFVVDLAPRRTLIVVGLAIWSAICALTATARQFWQLVLFRAAEGLGESFYFPASMSILSDYHGPRTRSRALGIHQTAVYAGTVGGGALAGLLGERFGWRAPFWILGLAGMAFAVFLWAMIIEPARGKADSLSDAPPLPTADDAIGNAWKPGLAANLGIMLRTPAMVALLAVFAGANFVAAALLTWLPKFIYSKFSVNLGSAAMIATLVHLSSFAGALAGGPMGDWRARRPGGRMHVQAVGLLLGAPWIYAMGSASAVNTLIAVSIIAGLCKGVYDANLFASAFDVLPFHVRGTAVGVMNTVGWGAGSFAPVIIGAAADRFGMSLAIASMSAIYVVAGLLAFLAAALAARSKPLAQS